MPDRIAALEAEQTSLHARMADSALYEQAAQDATQEALHINARLAALEVELDAAMQRWEELEARAGSV